MFFCSQPIGGRRNFRGLTVWRCGTRHGACTGCRHIFWCGHFRAGRDKRWAGRRHRRCGYGRCRLVSSGRGYGRCGLISGRRGCWSCRLVSRRCGYGRCGLASRWCGCWSSGVAGSRRRRRTGGCPVGDFAKIGANRHDITLQLEAAHQHPGSHGRHFNGDFVRFQLHQRVARCNSVAFVLEPPRNGGFDYGFPERRDLDGRHEERRAQRERRDRAQRLARWLQ